MSSQGVHDGHLPLPRQLNILLDRLLIVDMVLEIAASFLAIDGPRPFTTISPLSAALGLAACPTVGSVLTHITILAMLFGHD